MRADRTQSRYQAGALSPQRRAADLERMRTEHFDVLIIGGGVTGTGAALDAASRGLKVALVEARDYSSGTSSRSSKLIHGGLRYLEQFEFGLVHEALTERGLLCHRIAPHLVHPLAFLAPLSGRVWQRAYYGAGLALYDTLATALGGSSGRLPLHRHLSKRRTRRLFPGLSSQKVLGSIKYFDAQTDDARFVTTMARTAASYGAAMATSARVVGFQRDARQVTGARVADMETGDEFDVSATTIIAATGVWSNDLSGMLGSQVGLRVRASKGIHLVVKRSAINGDSAIILRTSSSVLFILPWGGHWVIGTTDTDWSLDRDHPAASAIDVAYLLELANGILERPLSIDDVEGVYAGLRPLLSGEDEDTSSLSREHAVVEPMLGLLLVAGGKFTTYRIMAKDAVDRAARRLHGVPASRTADIPLLGADGYRQAWAGRERLASRTGVHPGIVEHLLRRYGTLAQEVLALIAENPKFGEPLAGAPEYLAAEVVYAVRNEGALHTDDVLTRRTRVSIETSHRGEKSVEHVVALMGDELGWDKATRDNEISHYLSRVAAERDSQRQPDDATADAARLGAEDVRVGLNTPV
ncbi:glycerol-3-phosphate dehydrogenase/oxidase [Stackebrandtia nassauensis]|uniref:Glycerol-3-phosphate dehydrogenase n=1 Tax=Stackebrandtia nassauensis (strain DSM 44728 / CIP 108903 / NRRL B-16338 / NBRC 102104 / LLR-40K-21) TaxID=446470 RepID=D3PTZ1_STANL|nr:glycerol-3-phosphate dehydrogenase/oxidase [Stackebrandtia nassauensis]ADD39749.1 FAD dependent oxidoreductase [Stackebrandtia nassauensis DSM 44728]